jgi:hypothetical protein
LILGATIVFNYILANKKVFSISNFQIQDKKWVLIKKTKLNNIVREKVRQRIKKKKEKKNVCENYIRRTLFKRSLNLKLKKKKSN